MQALLDAELSRDGPRSDLGVAGQNVDFPDSALAQPQNYTLGFRANGSVYAMAPASLPSTATKTGDLPSS